LAINALVDSGFAVVLSVNSLLNQPVPTADRLARPNNFAHMSELPVDEVRQLIATLTSLQGPISAVRDPQAIVAATTSDLMLPLSLAFREHYQINSDSRPQAVATAIANAFTASGTMGISGTGLTLISDSGLVPLNVWNHLPSDAVVRVVLTPDDSRLLVEDQPLVQIPQGVTQLVYVPVRAIASGDVMVTAELVSESGLVVASLVGIELRIRAGWETVTSAIIAGALVLLLIIGIVRTIKRGRSSSRTTAATVSDPKIFDSYS
jgi:hypothetical protein